MAEREIIREFLVALGYHVDGISARKFADSLASVSKSAGKAAAVIAAVGVAAEVMVKKFASNMERLFYMSQRNKASVSNIQALEYAFSQVGLSAEDGASAIESFGRSLRMQPGLVAFIKSLGVASEGRDTIEVLYDTVEQLAKLPHFQGAQWAEMLGLDEKTFTNLKNNLPKLRAAVAERKAMEQQAGFDAQAGAAASTEYMTSLRKLWEQIEILSQAFAVKLLPYFRDFNDVALYAIQNVQKLLKSGFSTELGEWGVHLKSINRELLSIAGLIERTWGMISGNEIASGVFSKITDTYKGVARFFLNYTEGMLGLLSGNWSGAKAAFGRMLGGTGAVDAVTNTTESNRPAWIKEGRLPNEREMKNMLPEWMGGTRSGGGAPAPTQAPPAIARGAPRGGLPLGMQQNNPGNLRSWGQAPVSRGFAMFDSAQQGLSAMAGNLLAYAGAGRNTISSIISQWAPRQGSANGRAYTNNTDDYIKNVAGWTGFGSDQQLNLRDPATLARLMAAMTRHEQGYQPFSTNDYVGAAASRGVTLNQRTEINVNGTDASSTGRAVASEQGRVNSDMLRNFRGAAR